MQGVELVYTVRLLDEDFRHPLTRDGEGGLGFPIADDLAADIAIQPSPQLSHSAHGLLVSMTVDQPRDIAPRLASHAQERLPQLELVLSGKPLQPSSAAHQQVTAGGMGNRLRLHRRIHRQAREDPKFRINQCSR